MEISKVYNKVIEIEGLLLLLKSEDEDNYKINSILTLLFDKIDEINVDLNTIYQQQKPELCGKNNSRNLPDEFVSVDTIQRDGNNFETVSTEVTNVETDIEEVEVNNEVNSDSSDACPAIEKLIPSDDNTNSVKIGEILDELIPISGQEPQSNTKENYSDASRQQPSHDTISFRAIADDTGVDVNQSALASKARGDIRKLFTLNDIFKFRRQLFANSQANYAEALSDIENMKSVHDAEDYFYVKLGWDKENSDVKEFMSIISTYFLGK